MVWGRRRKREREMRERNGGWWRYLRWANLPSCGGE
jgi:hypothetical protein